MRYTNAFAHKHNQFSILQKYMELYYKICMVYEIIFSLNIYITIGDARKVFFNFEFKFAFQDLVLQSSIRIIIL